MRDGILFVTNINDDVTEIRTPVKTNGFEATRHIQLQKSQSFSVAIENDMRKSYKILFHTAVPSIKKVF